MKGKDEAKAVADCVAGNANSNILLLNWYQTSKGQSKSDQDSPVTKTKGTFDLVVCRPLTNL